MIAIAISILVTLVSQRLHLITRGFAGWLLVVLMVALVLVTTTLIASYLVVRSRFVQMHPERGGTALPQPTLWATAGLRRRLLFIVGAIALVVGIAAIRILSS
jgi:hypothetical protein